MNFKAGKLLDSEITLNWTLPLYAMFAISQVGWQAGLFITAVVFVSVLAHELGHVLAARKFGVPTGGINLNLFGGMATINLDKSVEARQEALISLAGPAVSLGLAGLAALIWSGAGVPWMFAIAWMNALLFVFNMLPAFPMDGGRIFRSLLRYKLSYEKATSVAVSAGWVIFGVIASLAIYNGYWMLLAMTGFLALTGWAEKKGTED